MSLLSLAMALSMVFGLGGHWGMAAPDDSPKPGTSIESSRGEIVTDGIENEDESAAPPTDLAEKVAEEIHSTLAENNADDLLNLATEMKLSAESVLDLTKVITYCIEAEKKGISGESLEFCRQLKISSQLERGLSLANLFMEEPFVVDELPHGWEIIRSMAMEDLTAAVEMVPDLALAQLVIGRLELLPVGDKEKAKSALDAAIVAAAGEPQILAEAIKYRSTLAETPDEAIEMLDRAMNLSKGDSSLLSLFAVRLSELNREAEALVAIDSALVQEPENREYKKTKARILVALDRIEEAESLFEDAMADAPDTLMAQVERGQFFSMIGRNDKAIALFTTLIDDYGTLPAIYYLRGALYAQEKDYKNALRDVNQALRIDPSFTDAIFLKGMIYLQLKISADAVRMFEMLRAKSPNDEMAVAQLAYALAQNDDYTGAIRRLNALLKKKTDDLVLLRCQGDIALLYGQWEKATAIYERILELAPNDSATLNNYAWMLATSPNDAVRNGKKSLELGLAAAEKTDYKESHILSTLAAAYAEMGDFDSARTWSEKAVLFGEKDKHDRLDDLRKELESYQKNEPWRETPEKDGLSAEEPLDDEPESAADFF